MATAALTLVQEVLETAPGERVFSSEEAVAAGARLGISSTHTYKLLSELAAKGMLSRPRGRLYVMEPPLGGSIGVSPLKVAVRAVQPAAVSGITALVHWELTEQIPLHEEVVSTSARIQWTHGVTAEGTDRVWHIHGSKIRFRHISPEAMFGMVTVRLDAATVVPMFDRERSIVELLMDSKTQAWAQEIVVHHLDEIDMGRLSGYAERAGLGERLRQIRAIAESDE